MLLCFVDESFKGDFYGFAAVLADEHQTRILTSRLNAVMQQAWVEFNVPNTTEIHGYPMFHGEESWKNVGVRARIRIYEQVIDTILDRDVTLLLRSIHRGRLATKQASENYPVNFPPEQVAFQHILQRADRIARRRDTYALMIADERSDRERHRERFAMYQTNGTPGVYMHTKLDRLLDTVHFAPSHRSRMLQAADILAFTYRRRRTIGTEPDARAEKVMARIWEKIESSGKVHDPGMWP